MKKRTLAMIICVLIPLAQGSAQELPAAPGAPDAGALALERLRLAATSDEYPVTPGDEYRLTYRQGDNQMTSTVIVEGNYSLALGLFGAVDAAGMSFPILKRTVEKLILGGYPRSMPSLTPSALGEFRVLVTGEVSRATYFTAWGLTRVSDVLDGIAPPAASLRKVVVVSRDGTPHTYDLYSAMRSGRLEGNPFVKPGDSIVLSRCERKARIAGEVRMPGSYELLPGERLRSLVESYGGGLLSGADATRVSIRRVAGDGVQVQYVDLSEAHGGESILMDGDVVTVAAKDARLPVVYLEGAIVAPTGAAGGQTAGTAAGVSQVVTAPYGRITHAFLPGQTISDALLAERGSISPLADLASAYVVREGVDQPISVDMRELLSGTESSSDPVLRANDRIVIPMSNFLVFVSGAVARPGVYPYAPNRTYQYYVSLAGGTGQESLQSISVVDRNGVKRALEGYVQSEDRIHVTAEMITVQGAVFAPGAFTYHAGAVPAYYITLAGGADPERNPAGAFVVYDPSGRQKGRTEAPSPGDRIYLPNNSFGYNLIRYTPVAASIAAVLLTILQLYAQFPR